MAHKFADWMIAMDGGQKVIEEFEVNGAILYTGAPNPSKVRKANTVNQIS